jgi:histidinol-phosphate aminotransferase
LTPAIAALAREALGGLAAYQIPHPTGIVAKLDANENPWPLPPEVAAELAAHLAAVPLHRYPDGGAAGLRALVARDLGRGEDELAFGNGSDELIALLIATFARPRPGETRARVAYPWPSFVVYRIATIAGGAEPVEIHLGPDFSLDSDRVDDALVDPRPNLIFFALPNNPTGTLWPRAELERVCAEYPDVLVVADEAYLAYSGVSHLDLLGQYPNLAVLRTLSKIGMAALRVGYLIASPGIIAEVEKVRPPYNVGSLNQAAAAFLLEKHRTLLDEQAARVVAERERLAAALARVPGLTVFPSRANFILVRSAGASALWQRLVERGVLVRNFDRPGPLAGCLRIGVGTPAENDVLLGALGAP